MISKDQLATMATRTGFGLFTVSAYLEFGAAAGIAVAGVSIILIGEDARTDNE